MKNLFLLIALLLSTTIVNAQYKPVDEGSAIKFTIANFGFDVNGTFSGLQGNISFDPQNLAGSKFDITIDASTVNTENSLRDKHLKDEAYFDVKNYPRIHIISGKITAGSGHYLFAGQLTIKGKTKEIAFPFNATPDDTGYIFKGSFKIKRKDFDLGGTSTIANELEISLNVHTLKVNA
jgi:polyisoprenoid-binding protein YceI